MRGIKKGDVIIIAIIFLCAAALLAFRFFVRSDNKELYVSYEETELCYNLDTDTEFTVGSHGHTLTVEIKEGRARVINSTCDGKDCVNMGEISQVGQSIACLPARFYMKIVSGITEGEYDGVVG